MIHWQVHSRRDTFCGSIFHLVQNVYHKPCPAAAGHLVFANSAHSRSLRHPSVKSREQTQSKLSLLWKRNFVFQKTILGNTFKILCSLPWIQGPAPEDGSLLFQLSLSPLQPGPVPSLGPCVLTGIVQLLSHV